MVETHKPDFRLELEVAADVAFLDCNFIGWPAPQSLMRSPHTQRDEAQEQKGEAELAAEEMGATNTQHQDILTQPGVSDTTVHSAK